MAKVAVVGIVGRTNGGKSTLVNTLVGEKVSIVSPVVQTTRNTIRAILDDKRGQLVLTDTPGLHKAESRLGTLINKMARRASEGVDELVVVFDVSEMPQLEDEGWMRRVLAREEEIPIFFFLNKCDRDHLHINAFRDLWKKLKEEAGKNISVSVIEGSAAAAQGTRELTAALFLAAKEGERLYDREILSDYPRRLAMADVVREKIFLTLKDELPHEVGVRVDSFSESPDHWHVEMTLLVSRSSQKPIVIGPGGRTIRTIRLNSERELTSAYGIKVKLDLWVKVSKDWSTDTNTLRQMGYIGAE